MLWNRRKNIGNVKILDRAVTQKATNAQSGLREAFSGLRNRNLFICREVSLKACGERRQIYGDRSRVLLLSKLSCAS
jgi:hypothetical protein